MITFDFNHLLYVFSHSYDCIPRGEIRSYLKSEYPSVSPQEYRNMFREDEIESSIISVPIGSQVYPFLLTEFRYPKNQQNSLLIPNDNQKVKKR